MTMGIRIKHIEDRIIPRGMILGLDGISNIWIIDRNKVHII